MGDRPAVSRVVEDYLTYIWKAGEWGGEATTYELAAALGVTPSTVSANLKRLARDGLIDYEPYGRIALTAAGRAIAVPMVRRHRLIETYLVSRLGLEWDEVHAEADAMEHAVSERVLARMEQALGFPDRDPHGDPIPAADGSFPAANAVTLTAAGQGRFRLLRVSDRDTATLRYLAGHGIRPGVELEIVPSVAPASLIQVRVVGEADAREVTLSDTVAAMMWGEPVGS